MKAGVIAVAAALAGSVTARDLGRRHGHQDFHVRGLLASSSESCGCTTVWSTVTGQPQLYFPPAPTGGSSASGSVPSGPAGSVPSGSAGTPEACAAQCSASYNSCRSAPDANRSSCASSYASCLGYSPYDNNGSLVTPTACSSQVGSSTPAPTASVPAGSVPSGSVPAGSVPTGSVGTPEACAAQCSASYNSCRSAPDANRSSCASSYASCLGYSPYDSNGSLVTPTACSQSGSSTPAPTASVPAGSVPAGSVPAGSVPAGSVPTGSVGTPEACAAQCSASYNSCRSAPDANRSSCASSYASCLGYSPYDSNGSLVTPTACSQSGSSTPAPTTSVPAGSVPTGSTGTPEACAAQCYTSYNDCRGAPDANRASCASSFASCLGYSPYDSNGSLVTPTACSQSGSSTPAPTTSVPAGSVPTGSTGTPEACAAQCYTSYNDCRGAPDANRASCASSFASCLGYSPYDSNGSLVTPTACSQSASSTVYTTVVVDQYTTVCPVTMTQTNGGTTTVLTTSSLSTVYSTSTKTVTSTGVLTTSVPAGSVPSGPAGSAGSPPSGSSPSGPAGSAGSPPAGSVPSGPAGSAGSPPAGSVPSSPAGSTPGNSTPGSSAPGASQGVSTAPNLPATSATPAVPTPFATTAATPGVYTIPATTVTLTESTTVCGATSTALPSPGTYTVGGVTTVVTTETTIVCPYAAITTTDGVVTSTILTTTYVCPAAGTYTINPLTTTVTEPAVWVYPTPASFAPGTYTQPEVVTTITETNVVVFCPYSSSAYTIVDATLPASTYAQATTAPAPVSTSVAVPVAPSSSAVPVVASSVASSVASPSASSSSSSGNGGSVGTSGNQWAMTYSPYQNSGGCKTAEEVATDVALIASKGFKAIRMYSTDCSGLENIGGAAKTAGLKLIIGIFISETGVSGAASQVTDLIAWGQWSLVELIVVGNEAVFNGYASATELAGFISSSSSSFKSSGYTGQVTTTEPLNIWQEYTSTLCAVVDITGANLHPFFNAQTTAENAGKFALSQLELAESMCPGKSAVNLECGWPSAGSCNGLACPGVSEQSIAIASIVELCGGRTTIFSYTDDYWKAPGAFGAEQHWGSIQLF
ncbi:hypothetical protein sscle_02g018140 [Sclerotinia sclerotiorum 1980 UF-70]|uniref:Probable beta-glucosidase btgE n=1 Tax=Sclerotinia sclerotiorum (strain ATCC 18683 / 1980 / Ss-1) TaxID=665079 RepID=A0A1D9PWG4_SCLS1|nr:hypothetical protein sscle_02g018140 [Sclerotinia sclerotiorum 1980 UF-70]